jgi:OmcA/MtrC family decaheme c-type cytochrome
LALPQVTNNLKDMIHGIHAGKTRTNPIRIARNRLPSAFNLIDGADITFPGILKNCESCHRPGTYSTVPANTLATTEKADNGVLTGGIRTTAEAKNALKQPNSLDEVTTPYTAACVSCHDSAVSIAHVKQNGGQILVTRGTMNMGGETCTVCHDKGKVGDPAVVHK